jgi:RNA polymerase sigma-70 factor (ECF subfamily)
MDDELLFRELLERLRSGDPDAASELVRRYEMAIRVAVRTSLSDPALRRQFDSIDVCQSVLASFFLRAAAGQYDLHQPEQLVALLTQMARNKLAMHARSHYRQRRDVRRTSAEPNALTVQADKSPGPEQQVLNRDLLDRAYGLMEPEVRQMAELRMEGLTWGDIATRLGGLADTRRQQFWRAMDRIAETLEVE